MNLQEVNILRLADETCKKGNNVAIDTQIGEVVISTNNNKTFFAKVQDFVATAQSASVAFLQLGDQLRSKGLV